MIGGKRYASRPEGAVVVKSQGLSVPIVSYVGVCIDPLTDSSLLSLLYVYLSPLDGHNPIWVLYSYITWAVHDHSDGQGTFQRLFRERSVPLEIIERL